MKAKKNNNSKNPLIFFFKLYKVRYIFFVILFYLKRIKITIFKSYSLLFIIILFIINKN